MQPKALLSIIFIFISAFLFAQETLTISGTVRDDNKQPLPGATIVVKGTTTGTSTDNDGKFSLQVPKDAKTLVISYIGYDNKEITIDASRGDYTLNVNMASNNITLNQVVYSVSRQKEKLLDAPASISVIGSAQLERNVVTTPVDELKTTPGVDVMRTGLVSSNVVVRGFNDIFSGSVLYVVDNRIGAVPSLRVNAAQLTSVSSLDYDKIEVVRGPASALYGPNASSGVIAIFTKSPLDQEKKFETTVAMTSG
ncbi:MAG TPA: carboxypeptidase-like regulatory domain-containing protein, partial [Chitinophagales bacterium]|nr:carboxypeptidase-like regulatory domain-containing protein [Chitinophagales bacterium]